MKKRAFFVIRSLCFLVALALALCAVNHVVVPQYLYNDIWPTTATLKEFYQLKRNTADVLFVGSSHAMCAFNPQVLYNDYGITSYNLSSEEQTLFVSYFWLKEALRYQKPKAVILDTCMLFYYYPDSAFNMLEAKLRKSIDAMRPSPVKWEAIQDICRLDKSQSALSYWFPALRFHTRWTKLERNDFLKRELSSHEALKGYSIQGGYCGISDYAPFEGSESDDTMETLPLMEEYLDKIAALCEQNDTKLILIATPFLFDTIGKYNTTQQYADKHGIAYYDLNESSLCYSQLNYSFEIDNVDALHANAWGAQEITIFVGNLLIDEYGVEPRNDSQWENGDAFYQQRLTDCELGHLDDPLAYLQALDNERYTVLVSLSATDKGIAFDNNMIEALRTLGFSLPDDLSQGYGAVQSEGQTIESTGMLTGTFLNGRVPYSFQAGKSITVDGQTLDMEKNGLLIAVYANDLYRVVDLACLLAEDGSLVQ